MLTNRTLARINNRPRQVSRVLFLATGGGTLALMVLAALAYALGFSSPFVILAVINGGALLMVYVTQRTKMTVVLSYKDNWDNVASRFSKVQEALQSLVSSEGIWCLPTASKLPKMGEAAPTPEREPAIVGQLPTPGIKADVPIWGIEAAGDGILFFFPEGMLLYKNDRYEPVSYNALKMTLSSGRFFEDCDLSSDATIVETVWRYSRPDGSPDPRYKNDNFEIPVILYSLLDIKGPSGLDLRLMVSNRRAAARFAQAFGARDLSEQRRKDIPAGAPSGKASGRPSSNGRKYREETYRSAEDLEKEARLIRARKALGVAKGATKDQVRAAYRELARTHHPDKVASLERELREYSEQRMKEINVAYAELKREWNNRTSEGARAR